MEIRQTVRVPHLRRSVYSLFAPVRPIGFQSARGVGTERALRAAVKIQAFFFIFLMGFGAASASATDSSAGGAMHLVWPQKSGLKNPVRVVFSVEENRLHAHFDVETAKINGKAHLGPKEYPYQHDVVEIFISVSSVKGEPFPYYEFELSPFDQTLEVRIRSLKTPFEPGLQLGTEHRIARTPKGWSADLFVPLNTLGWDGDVAHIAGNAYAILGEKPARSYWSLFLPPEKKPDFHRPEFFRALVAAPVK